MNFYPFSLSFTAAFSFILGFFVIYKNSKNLVNLTWGLGCLACGFWALFFALSFISPSPWAASVFVHWTNISGAFIPIFITHFCKELTGVNKERKGLIYFGYASGVFIALAAFTKYFCTYQTTVPYFPFYVKSAGPVYWFFTAHFFLQFFYGEYLLIRGLKSATPEKKNQIKYILTGLTLGYIGGSITFLPAYGIQVNLFPAHFVWLYAAIISYAILKHRLMDIKIIIEKTLAYSFFLAMTSIFYFLIVFVIYNLFTNRFLFGAGIISKNLPGLYAAPPLSAAIFSFGLGIFVYLNNRRSIANIMFAFLCLSFFIWLASYSVVYSTADVSMAIFFARAACTAAAFTAVFSYHFFISFLNIKNEGKWLLAAYVASFIFLIGFTTSHFLLSGVYHYYWGYYSRAGYLHPLYLMIYFLIWGRSFYLLCRLLKDKDTDEIQKNRIKYILIAFFIALLAAIDYFPKYGFEFYPLGFIFILFFVAIMTYAITRHNLLDIRVVIKKTILYSLLVALISTIYVVSIFFIYKIMLRGSGDTSGYFFKGLILVFVIALLLKPLEFFLHRFIDKKFFKGSIFQIAEQKALLETELERRERLRSVGILAAGMAHEIKNPITAIQTFAEYLPKKYDDPKFREIFSKLIAVETKRVSEIVRDLLLFARPTEPKPEVFDVRVVTKSVVDLMGAEFARHKIQVEYEDRLIRGTCLADPSQIKQAFLNIVMNAVEAMKPHGSGCLLIGFQESALYCEVTVKDSGIGIPSEKIPHLFDPFYTDKEGGTGLGLAITHSIIEKNKGKIEIESAVGYGTSFKLVLPHA